MAEHEVLDADAATSSMAPSSAASSPTTFGEQWASAFGICIQRDGVAFDRARYAFLKDKLVFKMDAVGNADPLSAFIEQQHQHTSAAVAASAAKRLPQRMVPSSIIDDSDEDSDDDSDDDDDERVSAPHASTSTGSTSDATTWAQYFSDETLLYEINTDLERLYPAGHETLFQNAAYRDILRHVLFVWCKLHPDVSYRQGMHDVAAVVLYAFLVRSDSSSSRTGAAADSSEDDDDSSNPFAHDTSPRAKSYALPETAEADTFLVFEAMMLYLKPFYAIAETPGHPPSLTTSTSTGHTTPAPSAQNEPRLFASYAGNDAHGTGSASAGSTPASGTRRKAPKQPALARICSDIQYVLLQQTDPQLFYHLQNLEIVPETYCLRWIRLLLAREFDLDELLFVWDAMIHDHARRDIRFPHVSREDDYLHDLPRLAPRASEAARGSDVEDDDDADWIGFPLLRYLCVAKLLGMSKQLRATDSTGCWRLLMQTPGPDDRVETHGTTRPSAAVTELIRTAQVLRDPTLATRDGPNGIDVVAFEAGSLGIILTAATAPFTGCLAVKDFVDDPSPRSTRSSRTNDTVGQAKASGRVFIGDILYSINGVVISDVTTEEVKRHIQLIGRPMYMGFLHPAPSAPPATGAGVSETLEDATAARDPSDTPRSSTVAVPDVLDANEASSAVLATHFLPGELCYAHVETSTQSFVLAHDGSCLSHYLSGKLSITNYRCFFTRLLGKGDIDWQVPVLSIASIDGMDSSSSSSSSSSSNGSTSTSLSSVALDHAQAVLGFTNDVDTYSVVLRCKDTQVVRLSFANYSEYSKLVQCLSCLAFPSSLLDAFCFAYAPTTIAPSEEVPFDIRREYERLGLLDVPDRLRCIDQSQRYDLCETYPQHVVVPAGMSDVRIKAAAAFRSGNRLPVVSWLHRGNGATISRSSQPLVGLKSARSMDDELLVRLLCTKSSTDRSRYVIMDARSQLAAVGNKAMGKGTEVVSNYRGAKLVFLNMDNIHAVRQSYQSLTALFEPRRGANEDTASFYSKLESSGWLRHVRYVLKASVELAHAVHNGVSVLTHCSDGWDRTAQMVSLAELMLDPYYRTLRGFQVLIEKAWCSFGHQFGLRCGHARSDATHDQRSPVFLLWLDCVWQFVRQQPSECEFNEKLLLTLADHVYACKYGTFMFDCERQRKEIFAKHRVRSIWSEVNSNSELFTSPLFAPSDRAALVSPSTLSKNIKLWKGYFCRWDTTIVPPVPAFQYY